MSWWSLHRDLQEVRHLYSVQTKQLEIIQGDLREARNPEFVEREARERLNLVSENDLVFVFPGDE